MKVAFLDRDGVINQDIGYLFEWEKFKYKKSVKSALKALIDAHYRLIIVTNQSGIARGYYNEDNFHSLTLKMRIDLLASGIILQDVFYCPHLLEGKIKKYTFDCECRKPKPGMFFQAFEKYTIDRSKSVMFGDKISDMEAAHSAGIGHRFLISDNLAFEKATDSFSSLQQAVDRLLIDS